MTCPTCGRTSAPDAETGYDGGDYCSEACEIEARPVRHLVEVERAGRRWQPATLGGHLLGFDEPQRADFMRGVLTLRRFALPVRVVETRERDAELRVRATPDAREWLTREERR